MNYLLAHLLGVTTVIFAVALLVLAWTILDLRRKWNRTFRNRPSRDALGEILERLSAAEEGITDIRPRLMAVEGMSRISIQRVGFLRFNPFEHTGGDQSFAIALLDHMNSGFVVSSLYTREGVRVYAKEIEAGTPKQPLSNEEQKVLEEAMSSKL